MPPLTGTPTLWIAFFSIVIVLIAFDLGILHRKGRQSSLRESFAFTLVCVALGLIFNVGVYYWFGTEKALEFLAGYLIEQALSVDNIFVFIVVMSSFAVPRSLQHNVLFWGVFGALVMRAIFIFVGTALLIQFHWMMYAFGGILIVTAIRLLFQKEEDIHPEKNMAVKFCKKFVPLVGEYHGTKFTILRHGRRYATPLVLVIVTIEFTDLVFALDSIPAVLAITLDPFIVYTSNIFAILCLRSLFFVLSGIMDKFHYLKIGLSAVLLFVGAKMMASDVIHVPVFVSLMVIAGTLSLAIIASFLWPKSEE